jgi:hypothetical protein
MTGMATVVQLAPRHARRERVRAVEEAIAAVWPEYERALEERENVTTGYAFPPRLRLVR